MKRESDLYGPVKALLERQGYEVKGEVGKADLVARRGGEEPLVVELKLRISLTLFHQAVARLALSDRVYIAVPRPEGAQAKRAVKDNLALCRCLGLGFITVRGDGVTEVLCDPGGPMPRRNPKAKARLLREFDRLRGDPNDGGATRYGIVTGYRQDALRCAAHLAQHGPSKGAMVAKAAGVKPATRIMAENHYGWFQRVETGIYDLTETGRAGLVHWAESWEE